MIKTKQRPRQRQRTKPKASFLQRLPNCDLLSVLTPLRIQRMVFNVSNRYERFKKRHSFVSLYIRFVEAIILLLFNIFSPFKLIDVIAWRAFDIFIRIRSVVLTFLRPLTTYFLNLVFRVLEFFSFGTRSKQSITMIDSVIDDSLLKILQTLGNCLEQIPLDDNFELSPETGYSFETSQSLFETNKNINVVKPKQLQKEKKLSCLFSLPSKFIKSKFNSNRNRNRFRNKNLDYFSKNYYHNNIINFEISLKKLNKIFNQFSNELSQLEEKSHKPRGMRSVEDWNVSAYLLQINSLAECSKKSQIYFRKLLNGMSGKAQIFSSLNPKPSFKIKLQKSCRKVLVKNNLAGRIIHFINFVRFKVISTRPENWHERSWVAGIEESRDIREMKKVALRGIMDIKLIFWRKIEKITSGFESKIQKVDQLIEFLFNENFNVNQNSTNKKKRYKRTKPNTRSNIDTENTIEEIITILFVMLKKISNIQRSLLDTESQVTHFFQRLMNQIKFTSFKVDKPQQNTLIFTWIANQIWFIYLELQCRTFAKLIYVFELLNQSQQKINNHFIFPQKNLILNLNNKKNIKKNINIDLKTKNNVLNNNQTLNKNKEESRSKVEVEVEVDQEEGKEIFYDKTFEDLINQENVDKNDHIINSVSDLNLPQLQSNKNDKNESFESNYEIDSIEIIKKNENKRIDEDEDEGESEDEGDEDDEDEDEDDEDDENDDDDDGEDEKVDENGNEEKGGNLSGKKKEIKNRINTEKIGKNDQTNNKSLILNGANDEKQELQSQYDVDKKSEDKNETQSETNQNIENYQQVKNTEENIEEEKKKVEEED
ncbi:hypothetical protein M0812_05604 [Anaeramoeba flamelloides]|uniref:Uncharacterized protein n=1 Tax=Anaeramoeba flamelloides TaxID=1746091 RepID=A0AAV8AB57_9EUKA|nr:hypothetical protein M0812_05604 [Anaeramoeba flamelloides]